MRKLLQSAVLFCVLLLLFSGCSKTEAEGKNLDHIRISNLKTSSMELTQEEQMYMDEVCSVLSATEMIRDESNEIQFNALNTSPHDLYLDIHINIFDKDGRLRNNSTISIVGWEKNQKLSYFFWKTLDEEETLTFIGEYVFNDAVFMTDPITLPIASKSKSETTLDYNGSLPAVISLEQSWSDPVSYSLLDFSVKNDNGSAYHSLSLLIRKESGEDNQGDSITIRILDEDGHVHYLGSKTVYLSCGETARVVFSIPIYEPGEYYLELK